MALSLTLVQILNLAYSPGISAIRLDGTANVKGRHRISITVEEGAPSPRPYLQKSNPPGRKFASLKKLVLHNVTFDFPQFFLSLGVISSLEELEIELAPPCPFTYPPTGFPVPDVPYWYTHGAPAIVQLITGPKSNLRRLRLSGFNCYDTNTAKYDILDDLLDPHFLPHISEVFLSGFKPSLQSGFWKKIQLAGLENQAGMLPIKKLVFNMKHWRDDGKLPLDYGELETIKEIHRMYLEAVPFDRPLRIDFSFDAKYHQAQIDDPTYCSPGKGVTFLKNHPQAQRHTELRGKSLWFCHWHTGQYPLPKDRGWAFVVPL